MKNIRVALQFGILMAFLTTFSVAHATTTNLYDASGSTPNPSP